MHDAYREICIERYRKLLVRLDKYSTRQSQCMQKMFALIRGRSEAQVRKMEQEKGLVK